MGWRDRGFGWNCLIGLNENASPYAPYFGALVLLRFHRARACP